jgi:hypothetical protein
VQVPGVGTPTGYGLEGPGSIPAVQNFSLHSVETGSGVHLTSYPVGTGALSLMVKRQGVMLTTNFHLVPRCGMVELYLCSPIRLHGVVLN